jgi:Domain of unknown function (DUF4349)
MSRRRGTGELTFEAQRELEALEAAVRGEPVAPEHQALAELALALREERPRPNAEFARALDARAAHGFRGAGSEERSGARARGALAMWPLAGRRQADGAPRRRVPRRRLALGLGAGSALAALVVASVVVLSGGRSEHPRPGLGPAAVAGPTVSAPAVSGAGRAGQLGTAERGPAEPAPPAIAGAEAAPAGAARAVERTATLDVGVSRRSIQSTAGRVFTLVSAFGGYVRQSSVSSGTAGAGTAGAGSSGPGSSGEEGASFDVRVPSARLSAAIAALSHLGHVRSETNTTNDVTDQLGALRRALGDLRAERASVLKQLSAASSAERVAALKQRLRALDAQIGRRQAQLRALNARVDYTSLALSLTPEESGGASAGNLTPGGAAKDAARILDAALAVLVLAAAALLPLGAIVIAGWSAIALTRRRLREQALDAG